MDNENSPLAASAENTAKRKLITQPLIVALLAGALIGELVAVLPRFRAEGVTKLENYALLILIFAVALMLLRSVLKLVYIVRDLRAARAGTVRVPSRKEKTVLIMLAVFIGTFIFLGLLLAGFTAAQNAKGL